MTWVPLLAQVKYSMTTDRSFYQYGDSIKITIKAVNEGDTPDTLYMTFCDVNYIVDGYNLALHRPCPTVIVPYAIPPHDSVTWGSDYLPPFPIIDTLAVGRLAVVGELDGYWVSDTLWVNVLSNAVAAADSLFPLEKGDYWQYKVSYTSNVGGDTTYYGYQTVLGDTLLGNGRRYGIVFIHGLKPSLEIPIHAAGGDWEELIRIDSSSGCVYAYDDSMELRVDSLSMNPGDRILIDFGAGNFTTTVSCDSVYTLQSFGTERFTKTFVAGPNLIESESDVYYRYSSGIGCTYYHFFFGGPYFSDRTEVLTYAKVDGIEYGTLVDVEEEHRMELTYQLSQNFPNPFNPSTIISYQLPMNSHVTLKVYDVLGRLVRTLVNDNQVMGSHEVTFDGSGLPSGVYFYRLQAGGFSRTRKLVVLK